MFDHSTRIGGVQSGWNVADRLSEKFAFPFWTGNVPSAEKVSLFSALGFLLPRLTHAASPETVTSIWGTLPRPATLPETVTLLPDTLICGVPTKWALPAATVETMSTSAALTDTRIPAFLN